MGSQSKATDSRLLPVRSRVSLLGSPHGIPRNKRQPGKTTETANRPKQSHLITTQLLSNSSLTMSYIIRGEKTPEGQTQSSWFLHRREAHEQSTSSHRSGREVPPRSVGSGRRFAAPSSSAQSPSIIELHDSQTGSNSRHDLPSRNAICKSRPCHPWDWASNMERSRCAAGSGRPRSIRRATLIRQGAHAVQPRQSADRAGGPHDPPGSGQPAARRGPRRDRALRRAGEEPRAHPHLPPDAALALERRRGRDDRRGDGRRRSRPTPSSRCRPTCRPTSATWSAATAGSGSSGSTASSG